MLRCLPLGFALIAFGCGDAAAPATSDTPAVAQATTSDATTEAAPGAGAALAKPAGPTTEQCRTEIGPRITLEPLRLVAEQTFAASSPAHGAGCFVTAYDPVSLGDGSVYPYAYTYTDATGDAETTLAFATDGERELSPDPSLRLVAVGFGDTNADGRTDVVMVHDECQTALSWLAQDDGWVHAVPMGAQPGLDACTVAEATGAFQDYWADAVSP